LIFLDLRHYVVRDFGEQLTQFGTYIIRRGRQF